MWMDLNRLATSSLDLESPKGKSSFVSLALVGEQGNLATHRRCGSTLGACSISTGASRNALTGFVELSLLRGHPSKVNPSSHQ